MPPIFKTRWAPWPCATPPLPPWPPAPLARGGREELRWTNRTNLYFRPWRGFSCALMMATIIMATMMMASRGREGSKWTNLYFRLLWKFLLIILWWTNRTNFYFQPWRWFSLRSLLNIFQLIWVRSFPGLVTVESFIPLVMFHNLQGGSTWRREYEGRRPHSGRWGGGGGSW